MLSKSRLVQLSIMLLILLALIVWRTFSPINEKVADKQQNSSESVQVDLVRCDYFTPCELISEQGTFWLSVNNPPIKAEQWINFNLQSDIKNWRVLDAKIVGKSMFMGRIPVSFKPVAKETDSTKGTFTAKTLLGACTTKEMIWQLQITAQIEDTEEQLLFDFMVRR